MKLVYFIQDTRGGEIAIGVASTRRLEKELRQRQLGNPSVLKILGVIPATNADRLAKELCNTFSAAHVNGDWYEPVPDLVTYVRSRAKRP